MKKDEVIQKSNPIFAVLTRIKAKEVEASDALVKATSLKTSNKSREYYLINLPEDEANFEGCRRIAHHISVFKKYRDTHFGLSAYHYTATILKDGVSIYLHAYFDQYGSLLYLLTQDEMKKTIQLDGALEKWLKKISSSSTVHIMTEIFNLIDKLSSQHDADLQTINKEIDRLSRIVFAKSPKRENLKTAYEQYMKQVRKYIEERTRFNDISFEPDHATIKLLQGMICDFKLPEIAQKTPEQPSKPKPSMPTTLAKEKPPSQPMIRVIGPEKLTTTEMPDPEDEYIIAQKMLAEAIKLDQGKTTASSICHLHRLILDCLSQWNLFPAHNALDICIIQNRVLAKAKIYLKIAASQDNVDSVKMLLPLIKVVSQDLIETAALNGSVKSLSLLLEKYRGPRYFLYKIKHKTLDKLSAEKKIDINLSTLLHTEDSLPNACLALLLNDGCDPEFLTLGGYTLLQRAVQMKNLERVQILLTAGADVNRQQLKAVFSGAFQLSTLAEKRRAGPGLQNTVNAINDKIPDTGLTAAMLAAQQCDIAILKCLVEHPCNLGIVDNRGFTVLGYGLISAENAKQIPIKEEIVKYLVVDCGLDIHLPQGPDGTKQTVLHFAVQYGNLENVRILLNYGADPNIPRPYTDPTQRLSAFFSAFIRNHFDIAAMMLTQSKVPISAEEVEKIISFTNETQPKLLDQVFEVLNIAPYIEISVITLIDGEPEIKVEYLHPVADRIRTGLPPEIPEELITPITDDLSEGDMDNASEKAGHPLKPPM